MVELQKEPNLAGEICRNMKIPLKKMVLGRNSATPTIDRHGAMVVAATILGMVDSAIKRHKADGEWCFGEKAPHHGAALTAI